MSPWQYLQGIITTVRITSLCVVVAPGWIVGVKTWISLVSVVRSGLPSTARTPFIVHVTLRSTPAYVALAPAGMFAFKLKSLVSPLVKWAGPESGGLEA